MSAIEKRLEIFRKLPLKAQLAMIAATKASPVLVQNRDYLEGLERVHHQCLATASPEQRQAYEKASALGS